MPTAAELPATVRSEPFRSKNLAVRTVTGFSRDRLVVTFDSYNADHRLERPGFGEDFFRSRGVDAVHVIPRDNSWYHYREMPAAAEAVRHVAGDYRRVVTYGSSMGGYAAIRFGRAVGASDALALSPQFSLDRRIVPFETRWEAEAAQIDYTLERSWPEAFVGRSYAVFDPYSPDAKHVARFADRTGLVPIRIPNCGHPCAGYLLELGLLQEAVLAFVAGTLDPALLARTARARRRETTQFYAALASNAHRRRPAAARPPETAAPPPDRPVLLARRGVRLLQQGDAKAAQALFDRAAAVTPDDVPLLIVIGTSYFLAGRYEPSAAALRLLMERLPDKRAALQRLEAELQRLIQAGREPRWRRWLPPRLRPGAAVPAARVD